MSEYQYYEFRAIDRPLTEAEMDELRRISSRAEITSTSLTNTYHYGDFRGDPKALMHRYFDAFVYVSNWGTRQLMLRIPWRFIEVDAAEAYCAEDALSVEAGKGHVVIEFRSDDEGGGEWTDGEPWMPSLISIRDEIMRGDLRALYLGWLASCWSTEDEDAEQNPEQARLEPPVPAGLAKLSGPLKSLAEFLRVEDKLIEAAANGSNGEAPAEPSRDDLARWLKTLPDADKEGYLLHLIEGDRDTLLRAELSLRFREATTPKPKSSQSAAESGRRTVAQLFKARDNLAAESERKAAEKAAREKIASDRKRDQERTRRLDQLTPRQTESWQKVQILIATSQPGNYDQAVELLDDLRELARRDGRESEFQERIGELRREHRRKSSLIDRFDRKKLGL